MLEIYCSGTAYEIGYKHGSLAKTLVHGSIGFYKEYFQRKCGMTWDESRAAADGFVPFLERLVPRLIQEMKGLADGAGVDFLSIIALNVRSEISMGMMNDGCTSLAWKTDDFSVAGQNWDWEDPQKGRLVLQHIVPQDVQLVKISQVTEAGILGKIGLNSSGVGVFLNAIRARGVNNDGIPVHLALRVALECFSRLQAVERLQELGFGSAAHILVADGTGASSLEFTAEDLVMMEMVDGKIAHTNHFLAQHTSAKSAPPIFPDSAARMKRVTHLLAGVNKASSSASALETILEDTHGFPLSINRKSSDNNPSSTIFSIVADLRACTARVRLGRPSEPEGMWTLSPALLGDASQLNCRNSWSSQGVNTFETKVPAVRSSFVEVGKVL